MFPLHTSHRRAWLHRLLYNPALLGDTSPLPLALFDLYGG
jgi:hypothetical protein